MRNWSERHIRELIDQEYKRMGGGGDHYRKLQNDVNNYIEQFVKMVERNVKGYTIKESFYYTVAHYMEFVINSSSTAVLFQVPRLTDAQKAAVLSAYGVQFSDIYDNQIMGHYFISAHISGYFQDRFLGNYSDVLGFPRIPVVSILNNDYGYYSGWFNSVDLPYLNPDDADNWDGRFFLDRMNAIPLAIPLDAILPLINPLTGSGSYMDSGIVDRYLTDKNNTNRHIKFSYIKGFTNDSDRYDVEWLNKPSGTDWRDYSNNRFYFEYDTFIGYQLAYDYYQKVLAIL